MSQTHQLSACPGCEEPLETGDSFCEVCGYDLTVVPEPPADRPTVAIGTHEAEHGTGPGPRAQAPGRPLNGSGTDREAGPHAPASERSAHPPTQDVSAPDFGGGRHAAARDLDDTGEDTADMPVVELPLPPLPSVDDYALAAPGAGAPSGAAAAEQKVCVACRAGRIDTDGYCENCGHAQPRERDHQEFELGTVSAVSDRGLRHHRNEDSFAISEAVLPDGSTATIAVVCDGVSSATRPDEASAAAASAANALLQESLPRGTHPQQALHEAILAAAEAVNVLATQQAQPMEHDPHRHQNAPACTLVSSIVAGGLLVVGWIGDSRVYWVPDDRSAPPARLTEDDSWAAQMVAAGLMGEAEAYADDRAHAITGWLGADAYEIDPHTASFKPDRPGVVVVCTDGLWNYAESAYEMAQAVPVDAAQRPLHSAQVLVGHALDGGGHDNVTVAVVPFPMLPQGAGSAYA
ncbi:serine/threonine-protein phosphatase [Streptomyces sp. NBC_00237]|uniref:PP2C family protein-serine/threonine phosphatase n=1 Tax=Streptomyces sp. NBC_00237 TaxID=2975687 RepID=UPI002254BB4D|nr:PP2C family serine/threonine-protein phosphatase [Streptomyces sp. NBC_00237]MCX5201180.1 serine/threonine-protein phosphatase [Streptomyces sp. NBC_00237]